MHAIFGNEPCHWLPSFFMICRTKARPLLGQFQNMRIAVVVNLGVSLIIAVLSGGTACASPDHGLESGGQGMRSTPQPVKMDATEAKLYIDSLVLPVRQCSGFSDLKRNYVQGLVEPCVFAGTATTVYSYPSTDKTWLAWCSLDLPKIGVPRQDTYLEGECDRVLQREKSPTPTPAPSLTPTPVPTPAPTPQAYIECMNVHDDYFRCRCLLDDSAPGCR